MFLHTFWEAVQGTIGDLILVGLFLFIWKIFARKNHDDEWNDFS